MKALLDALNNIRTKDQEDCVLVSIVSSYGSTPGKTGAMMIVTKDGRRFGTIGGGAVEKRSTELAQTLLQQKKCHLERFRLHPNDTSDIGMICGGENDVFFRYIDVKDEKAWEVIEKLLALLKVGKPFWTITDVSEEGNGALTICSEGKETLYGSVEEEVKEQLSNVPSSCKIGEKTFFIFPMIDTGKVYLFGAGHISQALAPLLLKLGFFCGVYDDREEFLELEAFEGIDTQKIDPADISELTQKVTAADYICIMTHGHKDDFEIQHQVMKTNARYIGVIGSARKQKAVKEKILALGFTEDDFANVVSPIGLNIGANSPEEIAVCIAAQLIMIRAGRGVGERDWKR